MNTPPAPYVAQTDDDLPGMMALAKGVAEQRWPHTMDAQVWAAEYVKLNPGADEGTMLGWFANAIMAGYDTAQHRASVSASSETGTTFPQGWPAPETITTIQTEHPPAAEGTPRYSCTTHDPKDDRKPYAVMQPDKYGQFVRQSDYERLERELAEAKASFDESYEMAVRNFKRAEAAESRLSAAVLAEREACAMVCESVHDSFGLKREYEAATGAAVCLNTIRARTGVPNDR